MLQAVSVAGALLILGAFAANQLGWIRPSQLPYAFANLVGAGILTVVALADRQVGFVVLQGAWSVVSLIGIVGILRRRRVSPGDGPGSNPSAPPRAR